LSPLIGTRSVIYLITHAVFCRVRAFRVREAENKTYASRGSAGKIAGGLYTAALFIAGVVLLTDLRAAETQNSVLMFLIVALFFVSAPYFLVSQKRDEENFGVRLVLGFALIFQLIFSLAYSYFDMTVQMNSPNKVIYQIAVPLQCLYLPTKSACSREKQNRAFIFFLRPSRYIFSPFPRFRPSSLTPRESSPTKAILFSTRSCPYCLFMLTVSFVRQAFGKKIHF
jgi:hypothetical protein